ncbi:hypothetical protein Nepgr_033670 [Nepenthes gracilis]|uniref:Uncharacterized protein n=1 Tax=Nepenthes gracilis TaxID=150966 RepID=A0AAD3TMB4_NEPGR|nr:hypothetical protein Nepgr_033670 [Nepenthes gracilis]
MITNDEIPTKIESVPDSPVELTCDGPDLAPGNKLVLPLDSLGLALDSSDAVTNLVCTPESITRLTSKYLLDEVGPVEKEVVAGVIEGYDQGTLDCSSVMNSAQSHVVSAVEEVGYDAPDLAPGLKVDFVVGHFCLECRWSQALLLKAYLHAGAAKQMVPCWCPPCCRFARADAGLFGPVAKLCTLNVLAGEMLLEEVDSCGFLNAAGWCPSCAIGYQGAAAAVGAGLRVADFELIGGSNILSLAAVPGGVTPLQMAPVGTSPVGNELIGYCLPCSRDRGQMVKSETSLLLETSASAVRSLLEFDYASGSAWMSVLDSLWKRALPKSCPLPSAFLVGVHKEVDSGNSFAPLLSECHPKVIKDQQIAAEDLEETPTSRPPPAAGEISGWRAPKRSFW